MSHIQTLIPPDDSLSSAASIPAIALFADEAQAFAGIGRAGATLLRSAGPGLVLLMPEDGLAHRLYEAGALLVFA